MGAEGLEVLAQLQGNTAVCKLGGNTSGNIYLNKRSTRLLSVFCQLSENLRAKLVAFAEQLIEQRTPD